MTDFALGIVLTLFSVIQGALIALLYITCKLLEVLLTSIVEDAADLYERDKG